MFTPRLFHEADKDRLHDLIDAHSFGVLVAHGVQGGPEISHLPFLLDRGDGARGTLRVHVARANPIWRVALEGRVVAVFSGPDAYVSPRWYERPAEHVPTWSYAVVHAHGRAVGPMPPGELRRLLEDLTARHEASAAARGEGWGVGDMEPGLADDLAQRVVGFTIPIDHLEGKLKLGQDRSPADRARVQRALEERGAPADLEIARLMRHGGAGES
ncbi:MAG: FMN-binding negative transcriptional regulator [Polyangiaceae bacterium]|nr:FMN-binding negative transcriptional regulator [Polyangiaceae bacterium]